MMRFITSLSLVILTLSVFAADNLTYQRQINWQGVKVYTYDEGKSFIQITFEGAQYSLETPTVPVYSERFPLGLSERVTGVFIDDPVYDIPDDDLSGLLQGLSLTGDINVDYRISYESNQPFLVASFVPIRINPYNEQPEYLKDFKLVITTEEGNERAGASTGSYADHSVLSSGNWFKISVRKDGVYKLTYSDLENLGVNVQSIDPRNIRIYGNGGGMLPESLNDYRADDIVENAIVVSGENDGKFDAGDYILFYGESPNRWIYNSLTGYFNHVQNLYTYKTSYFLTVDMGPGKRVAEEPSVTAEPTVMVNRFTDYQYHERDLFNLINAGRLWFGEVFDIRTTFDTTFTFPDIDLSSEAYFKVYAAAKSTASSTLRFYQGSTQILTGTVNGIPTTSTRYAYQYSGATTFMPASADVNLKVVYQKPNSSSTAWLDYMEVNAVRYLKFSGSQMLFRSPQAIGEGSIAEFTLSNAASQVVIWDVTDPTGVKRVKTTQNGSSQVFRLPQDSLSEFLAWNGDSFHSAELAGQIENQDLHGMRVPDMLIISHTDFISEAERLAQFHRDMDNMDVQVIDIREVFNEFSSGEQDVTAIRNLMKMLRDKSTDENNFRYLLLVGDASFDYKNIIKDNNNYVPTWEDTESYIIEKSIASDDYYGFLDGPSDDLLDIGIGRLPVETLEQAKNSVDKIFRYATNSEPVMHDWRNVVTFVADDEDINTHFNQAEEMADFINTNYGSYNIDKIYVDAFPQYATAGGQRAPDVNAAINNRMGKGTLIMNYTGHGGEVGWGHERFLEVSDINSWKNKYKLPIFITATCEFSRYDDPERLSAGEMVFRNPDGGAIAMFTTARATYGTTNFNLNKALFEYMFESDNGNQYRFGDLVRLSKNKGGVVDNDKKFILLGDPALKLSYPQNKVHITSVNGIGITEEPDTLRALSTVQVTGEITDNNGNKLSSFNGTLYSIVFDKPSTIRTLVTDEDSRPAEFDIQNNTLYKGKSQVVNGEFHFSFIVPKDIAYKYGFGKISFYAASEDNDANGFYRNIVIGGFNPEVAPDLEGPDIALFMNDTLFQFGGITNENPVMLAYIQDESGVNTVGSGIGHDIVAILDANTDKPIILNDYYEAELDSYTSGIVSYPFVKLSPGRHTLSLKAWDVFNNSGEAYIEFVVNPSDDLTMDHLLNYPNPFNGGTYFVFEHNQAESAIDVNIRIFDLSGRIVMNYETTLQPSGYTSSPIYWNGCNDGGASVAKGAYLYRVAIKDSNGRVVEKSGKLIKTD